MFCSFHLQVNFHHLLPHCTAFSFSDRKPGSQVGESRDSVITQKSFLNIKASLALSCLVFAISQSNIRLHTPLANRNLDSACWKNTFAWGWKVIRLFGACKCIPTLSKSKKNPNTIQTSLTIHKDDWQVDKQTVFCS